jgi:hypothetical protein
MVWKATEIFLSFVAFIITIKNNRALQIGTLFTINLFWTMPLRSRFVFLLSSPNLLHVKGDTRAPINAGSAERH